MTANFTTSEQLPNNSSVEVEYLFEASRYGLDGLELLNIGTVRETFETGDFSAFAWETIGGSLWFVDNSTANTGTYSARSGAITHSNLTTLQISMVIEENGWISFSKKICTEADKDKLTFYIDNTAQSVWSGEVDWSRETFPVTAGTHKFKWIYVKDSYNSYGDDCCWIDDVQFPSASAITFLPALQVQAQVNLSRVTLTWPGMPEAVNYLIRRDGEIVAIQSETTFTQYAEIGTYVYSVTAIDAEHHTSLPAFVEVEVTTVGLDESEDEVRVYPNPVGDWLHVDMEQAFDYVLFNAVGQQVMQGESGGKAQLRCGDLPKGLYFLHIATPSQVVVKKVVVK